MSSCNQFLLELVHIILLLFVHGLWFILELFNRQLQCFRQFTIVSFQIWLSYIFILRFPLLREFLLLSFNKPCCLFDRCFQRKYAIMIISHLSMILSNWIFLLLKLYLSFSYCFIKIINPLFEMLRSSHFTQYLFCMFYFCLLEFIVMLSSLSLLLVDF